MFQLFFQLLKYFPKQSKMIPPQYSQGIICISMKFVMNSAAHKNLALVVKRNKKSFFKKKEKNCLFKKSQGESLNIVCLIFLTFEIIQKKTKRN
jgi:hypothetical protein